MEAWSECVLLLTDFLWPRAPGLLKELDLTHWQAVLPSRGSPSTFLKPLPVWQRQEVWRAELPKNCTNSAPREEEQSKGVPTCARVHRLHYDSLSLCGPANHTEEFGLLTLLLCCLTSCVGSSLQHHGTGRDAELSRKQSLGSQRGTQSYQGKPSHKTSVVFLVTLEKDLECTV